MEAAAAATAAAVAVVAVAAVLPFAAADTAVAVAIAAVGIEGRTLCAVIVIVRLWGGAKLRLIAPAACPSS